MMHAVVGSMILMKKRLMMEVFPPSWREPWQEWELRGMILLSLTIQVVLVFLGNRRKYVAGIWIRLIVWSAYLLADSIATMAAGILSNNVGDIYRGGLLNTKYELTAFWAPLMLLHLGGTDAITAYSVEDNELWKRQLFGVGTQAMATLYILLMAWTGSYMSILFVVMFAVGLVKYSERVWVLYSASDDKFRDSIPDIPTNEIKIVEDCKLKQLEGYHKVLEVQVLEVHARDLSANISPNPSVPHAKQLLTAYSFLDMVKRLFADLVLGLQERDVSRAIFMNEDMNPQKAYEIIEIELEFIYDLLYTKAKAIYTFWGIARRIIGTFLTLIVLVVFLLQEIVISKKQRQHKHSNVDFTITWVLLAVAVVVDLCAIVELLLADQTTHWLVKHNKTNILRVINAALRISWLKKKKKKSSRWSDSIGQLSLLRFAFREKPLPCLPILKILGIDEMLEIYQNETRQELSGVVLKNLVLVECRDWLRKRGYAANPKDFHGLRGGRTLRKYDRNDLEWTLELEMDQSILVWHLATEICCYKDKDKGHSEWQLQCTSLSRYMLYLLVKHPYMLPIGLTHIKFREIYDGIRDFAEEQLSKPIKEELALEMLAKINAKELLTVRDGDKSTLVIFYACKLSSALSIDKYETWDMMRKVWLEMLCHVASQCRGRYHAQQLRRGGEFLTHVWLLMAHCGLTDHFEIRRNPTIGEVVLS